MAYTFVPKKMDLVLSIIRKVTQFMKDNIKMMKNKVGEEQLIMKVSLEKVNVMVGVDLQFIMKYMKVIF